MPTVRRARNHQRNHHWWPGDRDGARYRCRFVPRLTSRAPALAAVVVAVVVAVSCSSGDDSTFLDEVQGDSPPSEGESASADEPERGIQWEECNGGFECGTIDVPLDYDDPDSETITLSVARAPASGDRIGALFVNPGGPGATASDFALGMSMQMPDEITERFDIVGVDPRGTGASEIDCGGDFTELYGLDHSIDSPEDQTALLAESQAYVDGCEQAVGDLLPHLGTVDNARDLDAVREALGDDQLSYLGYSFGTALGQAYAEEFPERVRAMVLDAVVELGPTGVDLAEEQAVGFESALRAFADDCNARESCPLAPDAMAAIDELNRQVEAQPISAEPRDLGPGELGLALAEPLYDEGLWPSLADAVDDALAGDGSGMVSLADDYLAVASFDVYFAVNCLDFTWPEAPEELLAAGAATAQAAPHFGEPIVNDYVRCAMWPVEAQPLGEVTAPGTPPILVVSTTGDPATPYEAGVRTAEKLESGVLLTHEGEGHGVVFSSGVSCVDDAAIGYLVDLDPPEDGTTCD
jgi:pimeloyl-ACP methyl ester carboxylesterase